MLNAWTTGVLLAVFILLMLNAACFVGGYCAGGAL